MIYLIGQLSIFLVLTAAFAAVAGWSFAARQAEPTRRLLRNTRERLVRDLALLATGEASADERAVDTGESLSRIREARIAELERALETARARADDAVSESADLRRQLERAGDTGEELTRLRAFAAEEAQRRARVIDAVVEPAGEADAADDDSALQAWRLRYFEQRVSYLEGLPRAVAAPAPSHAPPPSAGVDAAQQLEWRAREAEARAAHLEQEVRTLAAAAPSQEAAPSAANADADTLLRWRMLYLERRLAHLQQAEPPRAAAPAQDAGADPDRWKWRARYLEARVRHLEQRPAAAPSAPAAAFAQTLAAAAGPDIEPARAAPPTPARPGVKPPVMASPRNGAPDDLTMIDSVSQLQQTALYSLGVFHFDQIAAWTSDNIAWVDQYFRLRGRIDEEDWVDQADELAHPAARGAEAGEAVSP